MTSEVETAITELRATFNGHAVEVREDGQGGATVIVSDLDIGDQYEPNRSGIGFVLTFQYPAADVYPHFLVDNPRRVGGAQLGKGMSNTTWNRTQVVQVSRRSKNWKQGADTAAIKLLKVLEWIRTQ